MVEQDKSRGEDGGEATEASDSAGLLGRIGKLFPCTRDNLDFIDSILSTVVKGFPSSLLVMSYAGRGELSIIGASTLFMSNFRYNSSQQVTFDNVFRGENEFISHEQIERALKNPLHRAFSFPLPDPLAEDEAKREPLIYFTKIASESRDIILGHFPSKRLERHHYLIVEMNRVGYIRRKRGCFKDSYYVVPKDAEVYGPRIYQQVRALKKLNKKGDRPVLWDCPVF